MEIFDYKLIVGFPKKEEANCGCVLFVSSCSFSSV